MSTRQLKYMVAIIVSAMICFVGCTPHTPKAVETSQPSSPQTVIAGSHTLTATGAVIVKHDDKSFYYKKQCLACGFVAEEQIGSAYPKDGGMLKTDFTCPKCEKKQEVKIIIK